MLLRYDHPVALQNRSDPLCEAAANLHGCPPPACAHTATYGTSTELASPICANMLWTHLLRRPLPRTQESSAHTGCAPSPSPSPSPFPTPLHNMPSKREDAPCGWEGGDIKVDGKTSKTMLERRSRERPGMPNLAGSVVQSARARGLRPADLWLLHDHCARLAASPTSSTLPRR